MRKHQSEIICPCCGKKIDVEVIEERDFTTWTAKPSLCVDSIGDKK